MSKRKAFKWGSSAAALLVILLIYILLWPNMRQKTTLLIEQDTTYDELIAQLSAQNALGSVTTFRLAGKMLYYKTIRPGKYTFAENASNLRMVYTLRKGQHFPVRFTFTAARTKEQLVQKLSKNEFLFDWDEILKLLNNNSFLSKYGFNSETSIAVFIPNTYEFYYDITAEKFFEKMYGYYQQFWTPERLKSAEEIGLTPLEVITLASIVEEENYRDFEKPTIAGLYMNRLHKGMKLQSDPTVKFAVGDFTLRRVLNEHLEKESPYNTYLYEGLPPGPIRIPAASSIDAVLHYEHNNYLYMCAKEDFSGAHNFTDNYQEHLKNARRYQAALNERNIK